MDSAVAIQEQSEKLVRRIRYSEDSMDVYNCLPLPKTNYLQSPPDEIIKLQGAELHVCYADFLPNAEDIGKDVMSLERIDRAYLVNIDVKTYRANKQHTAGH
jgi:hypothetical protein